MLAIYLAVNVIALIFGVCWLDDKLFERWMLRELNRSRVKPDVDVIYYDDAVMTITGGIFDWEENP